MTTDTQELIGAECDLIKNMLLTKNREYGDSAVNPLRIFSASDSIEQIRVRIDDKLSRLRYQGAKEITEDTVADLIGYLILLRVAERRRGQQKRYYCDRCGGELSDGEDSGRYSRLMGLYCRSCADALERA